MGRGGTHLSVQFGRDGKHGLAVGMHPWHHAGGHGHFAFIDLSSLVILRGVHLRKPTKYNKLLYRWLMYTGPRAPGTVIIF